MAASMLSRQRKRRRDATFRYAHDYLRTKRLPSGLPAELREFETTWAEDEIQFGYDVRDLRVILDPYRKPWTGL